jgi:hypothetical protein
MSTKRLCKGEVLVKTASGNRKRVKVGRVWKGRTGWFVSLDGLADYQRKSGKVQSVVLPLGEDGLPEGYRRESNG